MRVKEEESELKRVVGREGVNVGVKERDNERNNKRSNKERSLLRSEGAKD